MKLLEETSEKVDSMSASDVYQLRQLVLLADITGGRPPGMKKLDWERSVKEGGVAVRVNSLLF